MEVFGIPENIMLDASYVKVLDGIAGSAKSSNLHRFFISKSLPYGRYTSTNRLKADAEDRYGGNNDTIASGLFKTVSGKFYAAQKDPEFRHVVIDEVLQSSPQVMAWIRDHVGDYNIIVCTDSRQTLAPESEAVMLKEFNTLKQADYAYVVNLEKSYRPRTEETERAYNKAYASVGAEANLYSAESHKYVSRLEYDPEAVYICHTKAIEKHLYDAYNLYERYDLPLIPKGTIAKRQPQDARLYPILPQDMVSDKAGYWQLSNIATATRYQGCEVKQGQKCFYVVEPGSVVSNREWYTVVSRMYDIDDLYVARIEIAKPAELVTYGGKPIKRYQWANFEGHEVLKDGRTLDEVIASSSNPKQVTISREDMDALLSTLPVDDKVVPRREAIIVGGTIVKVDTGDKTGNNRTMRSLLRKEGVFAYNYMPEFYARAESVTKQCKVSELYTVRGPVMGNERGKRPEYYNYALDLKAAYPHILNYAKHPTAASFSDHPIAGSAIDWYVVTASEAVRTGAVVTGECDEFMKSHEPGYASEYLGSSSAKQGSKMGEWLHEQAHRSIEAKDKIKDIHYGYAERQYLEPIEWNNGEPSAYALSPDNVHALLMCSIRSELCRIMAALKMAIYGNVLNGSVRVDCLYFDYDGDTSELFQFLELLINPYDFRVTDNMTGDIIYQTYPDLKTEREIKNERRRLSRKKGA